MQLIGVIIGIGFAIAALVFVALPAWQVMLATDSWFGLAVLLIGTGVATSWINIPTPFTAGGARVAINLFGFFAPMAVVIYVANDIGDPGVLNEGWLIAGYIAMATLYSVAIRSRREGLMISLLLVYAVAFVIIFALRSADLSLRQIMFRGFSMQYITLLFADLLRLFITPPPVGRGGTLSIGGAGSNDVLWSGPTVLVIFSYIVAWIAGDLPT